MREFFGYKTLDTKELITPIEDMREFFGYKTLDTKELHSSLSKKPYKNVLKFFFIY